MCNSIQGPVFLGHIEIPAVHSQYSQCDECGKRSKYGIYVRNEHQNRQLCDSCADWADMAENDTARSIFDTHEDYSDYEE